MKGIARAPRGSGRVLAVWLVLAVRPVVVAVIRRSGVSGMGSECYGGVGEGAVLTGWEVKAVVLGVMMVMRRRVTST